MGRYRHAPSPVARAWSSQRPRQQTPVIPCPRPSPRSGPQPPPAPRPLRRPPTPALVSALPSPTLGGGAGGEGHPREIPRSDPEGPQSSKLEARSSSLSPNAYVLITFVSRPSRSTSTTTSSFGFNHGLSGR